MNIKLFKYPNSGQQIIIAHFRCTTTPIAAALVLARHDHEF
jgi:hypothetical protein